MQKGALEDSMLDTTKGDILLADSWQLVLEDLRSEFDDPNIILWLQPLIPVNINGIVLVMSAPTRFIRDRIKNKYVQIILKKWQKYQPQLLSIEIIVGRQKKKTGLGQRENIEVPENKDSKLIASPVNIISDTVALNSEVNTIASVSSINTQDTTDILDEKYTFENFVVGPSNELAYAAAKKVATGQSVTFNPLFFHGGVGLGKTHLMHAIAFDINRSEHKKSVIYLSAEQFMYRFIVALRNKDMQAFKEQFRNVDVLMIDDLQFIAGKTQTQEEFFHTFNTLVDSKKQVIISADRSPNDMGNMEDRIRSRLSCGLVVDIHQTDYSLRMGILKLKISLLQKEYPSFFVPEKVIEFLAHRITGNIRELEGALNRIAAHATFTGRPVTLDLTEDVISDLLRMYEKKTGINEIRKKICDYFGVKLSDLDSSRRSRDIAYPRQVAMYLTKSMTGMSYPEIGRKFGGKDHSTVIHAVHKIELAMNENNDIAEQIKELKNLLKTS